MSTRELEHSGDDRGRLAPLHVTPPASEQDPEEDKALTLAFKRGERGAYQAIYDRYSPRVHGVCRRMLLKPEDAEEAAQESFLRVYQALARFNGRYLLGPWITRITTNVCLDHLRAKSRRPIDLMPVDVLEVHGHCEQEELDPEHVHLRSAEGRRVRKLLESLPPMYRAAIVLRDFEGLSYAEVAQALEISETQTKALIHRARQAFKRSWSSALLAAPLRFIHRFRRFDPSTREQGTQAVGSLQQSGDFVSSASQVASSCGTMVQQCGHFFAERAATVATAAIIGTAAGAAGVVIAHPAAQRPAPVRQTIAVVRDTSAKPAAVKGKRVDRGRIHSAEVPKPVVSPAPDPAESPAPDTEPADDEPAAEPTEAPPADPEPADDDGAAAEPSSSPSPSPSPSPLPPDGFTMSFVMAGASAESCTCAHADGMTSSALGSTSSGIEHFDQVLEGTATAGEHRYGLWLHHASSSGTADSLDMRVTTPDGGYFYAGTGTLVDRKLLPWSGWQYTYSGTYHLASRPGGPSAMPSSGSYTAVVSASWEENRIVSTTFSLTSDG